jgi:hypothetical protein
MIGSVLDAIRAALILRSGLSGVNVYTGIVSMEEAGLECIAFGDARLNEEAASMGGNRMETWDVNGDIRVSKPWQGAIETTIKAARDRALAIFAELETHVNDTYTGTFPDVEVTAGELVPEYDTAGRVCWLRFTVQVQDIINP